MLGEGETQRRYDRRTSPLYDKRNRVTGSLVILRDITERVRTEKALRESEVRLRTLQDSIPDGILLIDAETHVIVDVNPAAVAMIGAPQEQVIASICHNYVCPAKKGRCPITDLGQTVDSSEWDQIFKNPLTTAAAIDRVVHHSIIIEFGREMKSVRAEEAARRNGIRLGGTSTAQDTEG